VRGGRSGVGTGGPCWGKKVDGFGGGGRVTEGWRGGGECPENVTSGVGGGRRWDGGAGPAGLREKAQGECERRWRGGKGGGAVGERSEPGGAGGGTVGRGMCTSGWDSESRVR